MRNLDHKPFYGVIKEYQHWVVLFRDKQVTLGSVIIMSKDLDSQSLGTVSAEGWSEFGVVCHETELLLSELFGAEKFNYLALMMVDPEVHFHVIPRYSKVVEFAGQLFTDPDWPGATKRVAMDLDAGVLDHIRQAMLSYKHND